jgi:hypothetical protein
MNRTHYLLDRTAAFLFLILVCLAAVGCTKHPSLPDMPDIGISQGEINTRVLLAAPAGLNTYKIGEIVSLTVEVVSDDRILFPHDYGAKIFVLEDNQWVEVPNLMEYPDGHITLSPTSGDPLRKGTAGVVPLFPDSNNKQTIRIILIGNIYSNGQLTDDQTAAYIDLEMNP